MKKLNIGAGSDIRENYINMDVAELPGIDVVHNLDVFPYPFSEGEFNEVVAENVLEHLDNFMPAMEELHRIMSKGGILKVTVPYWNSSFRHMDPTHKRGFHELTFSFFDPDSVYCKDRFYYTNARFYIRKQVFVLAPFAPYFAIPGVGFIRVRSRIGKRITGFIANLFSNIILDLELELEKV